MSNLHSKQRALINEHNGYTVNQMRIIKRMMKTTTSKPTYYSCKYWRNYRHQRKGHWKNWNQHYEACLGKKAVTLSALLSAQIGSKRNDMMRNDECDAKEEQIQSEHAPPPNKKQKPIQPTFLNCNFSNCTF
eukprot:552837_1